MPRSGLADLNYGVKLELRLGTHAHVLVSVSQFRTVVPIVQSCADAPGLGRRCIRRGVLRLGVDGGRLASALQLSTEPLHVGFQQWHLLCRARAPVASRANGVDNVPEVPKAAVHRMQGMNHRPRSLSGIPASCALWSGNVVHGHRPSNGCDAAPATGRAMLSMATGRAIPGHRPKHLDGSLPNDP